MPDRNKTAKLETLILNLLAKEPEVSIRSIAGVVGVSADDDTERKAIQRALKSLEKPLAGLCTVRACARNPEC